jgi:hypothetical protein
MDIYSCRCSRNSEQTHPLVNNKTRCWENVVIAHCDRPMRLNAGLVGATSWQKHGLWGRAGVVDAR